MMFEKFVSVVNKGTSVKITLSNCLHYEGLVVSTDLEKICVELATHEGLEFVSLTTLISFKILKSNAEYLNATDIIANDNIDDNLNEPSDESINESINESLNETNFIDFLKKLEKKFALVKKIPSIRIGMILKTV